MQRIELTEYIVKLEQFSTEASVSSSLLN